jgi:hypothetical protein
MSQYLNSLLPVSRFPLVVGYGHDVHYVRVIQIDDGEWEALEQQSTGTVQILRLAFGRERNTVESVVDLKNLRLASVLRAQYH